MVIQQGTNKDSFGVTSYLGAIAKKYLEDTWGKKSSGRSHVKHLRKFFVTAKTSKGKEKEKKKEKGKSKNKGKEKEPEKEKGKPKGKSNKATEQESTIKKKKKTKGKTKGKGGGEEAKKEDAAAVTEKGEENQQLPELEAEEKKLEDEEGAADKNGYHKEDELENLSSDTYIGQCAEGTFIYFNVLHSLFVYFHTFFFPHLLIVFSYQGNFFLGLTAIIRKELARYNEYCLICHRKHSCKCQSAVTQLSSSPQPKTTFVNTFPPCYYHQIGNLL